MKFSPLRQFRLAATLICLILFASACAGASDDTASAEPTAVSEQGTSEEVSTPEPSAAEEPADAGTAGEAGTAAEAGTAEAGTATAAAADAGAGAAGEAGEAGEAGDTEPAEAEITEEQKAAAANFMNAFFEMPPSVGATKCIVANSDEPLLALMGDPILGFGQVADYDVLRLSRIAAKCADPMAIGMWATDKFKPAAPYSSTAPICFGDRFAREHDAFANLVAFFRSTEMDEQHYDPLIDTLKECLPVTGLWDNFVAAAEARDNTVRIDRQCLLDSTDEAELSETFWNSMIRGEEGATIIIEAKIIECAVELYPGMEPTIPADFVPFSGTKALANVAPPARDHVYPQAPPMTIDPAKKYQAVFTTSDGSFTLDLASETAPIAVNTFVALAKDGFYDMTPFHRVIPDFMAQGGDPTGTGAGGPGFQFEDELEGGPAFDKPGVIGMANAGPGTNGSQFFITTSDASFLTGSYTAFGEVSEGVEVVMQIDPRDPESPNPGAAQTLISVEIIES